MTRTEAIEILKSILVDLQRTAKDTDNVSCCSKYGFITYESLKECINVLEQDSDGVDIIRNLPSVTPQEPKTGHWIDDTRLGYHVSICSNCDWRGHGAKNLIYRPNYCPNCGAKMVEA